MAEICCGVVSENEAVASCETSSRTARRRGIDLRQPSIVSGLSQMNDYAKRRRFDFSNNDAEFPKIMMENSCSDGAEKERHLVNLREMQPIFANRNSNDAVSGLFPKFGMASVCGRRRDMEDAVAIHPSFCLRQNQEFATNAEHIHYFGVYDGHGCSHVATRCRERMHEVVKEEVLSEEFDNEDVNLWRPIMERSFFRMDKEAVGLDDSTTGPAACRCELQMPARETVGSTAVVAVVTPRDIIVANCGDSRAVLCRNGMAIPLSTDHKPDRPDEMNRIQAVGGRVIFWEDALEPPGY